MNGGRQTCSRPPRVTVATICTGRVWPGLAAPENETPDPEASLSRSQTYIDTVVFLRERFEREFLNLMPK